MKKFIFCMVAILTIVVATMNGQTAIQTTKFLDNTYVGANVGAMTNLGFKPVFPIDATFGIRVGKNFTPVVGVNVEGTTWFGSATEDGGRFSFKTVFRAVNVGVNNTINLSNLIGGYNGSPRTIEFITVTGLGYFHTFNSNGLEGVDYLSAKTALDVVWNLGKYKQHQLYVEPGVFWILNSRDKIQFNRKAAFFALAVGYNYKFKCSNGTHDFVKFDIGALNDTINLLRAELAKKPTEKIIEKTIIKEVNVDKTTKISFENNSDVLSDGAKAALDNIVKGSSVTIVGTASPDGTVERNLELSNARAKAVADYLQFRGVNIISALGGEAGRTAIVTVQ